MESKRGKNHDLLEFRAWLNDAMPKHTHLHKVQVGGTNGKGSTIAWLNAFLQASGCRTGVFTSPHLIRHNERIKVNDTPISDADWERIYDQYADFFERHQFTMFEMDVWMALAYFLEQKVDIALMEVGMGGRLDATTALDYDMTLITNVSMEHEEFLGDSIEQITYEKSGIFKPGVVALTTETKPASQKVMELVAGYMKTPLGFVEMPYTVQDGTISFVFEDERYEFPLPLYQLSNCALALEAMVQLGYPLTPPMIREAIDHFQWPGRFTIIRQEPLLLVDGAHNIDGIRALTESMHHFKGQIFFAAMKDKHIHHMLEILETLGDPITLVHMPYERASQMDIPGYPVIEEDAMMAQLKQTDQPACVCGSLYLAGDVLRTFSDFEKK